MLKNKISIFFIVLVINLISIPVFSIEPNIFVQSTVNRASQILNSNNSKDKKIEELKLVAKDTVDIKGIGLYTLGKYRKQIKDDEKIKYHDLFEKYFLKSFSSRLAEYSDPKIEVLSQEKLNDKYTMVSSVLLATEDKPEVKIDWRVITKDIDRPLIIDVIIEGVSLAKVQKEEFNSIIQSNDGSLEVLFENLKNFSNK